MNCVAGTPLFQLVERAAEVVEYLLIDEFDLAPRRHERNQAGDRVHDQAKLPFPRERYFRSLTRSHGGDTAASRFGVDHEPSRRERHPFTKRNALDLSPLPRIALDRRDAPLNCVVGRGRNWRRRSATHRGGSDVTRRHGKRREERGPGSRWIRRRIGLGGRSQDSQEGRLLGHDRSESHPDPGRRRGGDEARPGRARWSCDSRRPLLRRCRDHRGRQRSATSRRSSISPRSLPTRASRWHR